MKNQHPLANIWYLKGAWLQKDNPATYSEVNWQRNKKELGYEYMSDKINQTIS